ncbi:MAG TPA: rod shape-determining protein MreC [Bacteroidales bacterium]|jgi:rod shape-determining protein MreC|nr:rod shape-determining protein MreC [Bacteroidales bacterium]MDI9533933.1 rod shape-determining protein MreC [Bacteroidota bacterium]MBK7731992.1 rod shape-determining protein MreC [Bacteroidales bacterium]MBP7036081.1 rod shape-determining protein MreC [Bacteroidales bacterium]HHU99868.1 rod shape-determining protein MreC [Bacteroidales bacterium]
MRSLLNFLLRFKTLILFLVLEAVALVMISTSHNYHQTVFYGLSRNISGFVARRVESATYYFRLRSVNEELVRENTLLRRRLEELTARPAEGFTGADDSISGVNYTYMSARVISNSVNKQKNFITLDRGSKHGVEVGMGVASPAGVVGVVVGTSPNYSVVMSLLNIDFRLSTSIARNDYFGSLAWDGINYRYAKLSEIPHHVTVSEGDTIITSGYSAIFPPGLMAGTVTGDQKRGGDFVSMKVMLSVDFKKLTDVYVIGNLTREEWENLEEEVVR